MRSAAPGLRNSWERVLVGVLMALYSAPPEAAAFLPASPARAGAAQSFFSLSMAAKKATKKGAAAAKPHIEVNKKFVGLKQLSKDPAIFTIDGFFDQATCARYLAAGPAGEASGESLKSTTWFLKYSRAPELIAKALTLLPDRTLHNCEEPQIVRYEMGDFFNWHEDALPLEEVQGNVANGGQRLATILVYLNDVPSSGGGATAFRDLNIKVLPKQGSALLFFPAFADGSPDPRTIHAGSPAFDTKWIAQMWIHQDKYVPAVPPGNSHEELLL